MRVANFLTCRNFKRFLFFQYPYCLYSKITNVSAKIRP